MHLSTIILRVGAAMCGGGGSHRLVREWRQDDGLLHGVHHQLPQLLQYALQHSLLTDLGK